MRKKDIRLYLFLFVGIVLVYLVYYLFILISSLTFLHWLIIFVCMMGFIFIRQKHKEKLRMIEAEERRLMLERQGKLEDLMKMNWREFEQYICDLFLELGFSASLTPPTGDSGKDLIIHKDDFFAVAECKRYGPTTKVSRPDIQKFHSAIIHCEADQGYFITTGEFSKHAESYALDKPIILINGEKLVKIIQEVTKDEVINDPFVYLPSIT